MRIAVAGGTGLVGSLIVRAAKDRGHDARPLSRAAGVDLLTRRGLAPALDGVDTVIDASNITTMSGRAAREFFTTATGNLLQAEREAGVGHHVLLSIVAIERVRYGYYEGKLAQEKLVAGGAVPWTIQRTTQFHEFARQVLAMASVGPVHLAPRGRVQPVAAEEVAHRLVDLAEQGPQRYAREFAGPREEDLADMIVRVARVDGARGPVIPVALPMEPFMAMRRGTLLPGRDHDRGNSTFADWLRTQ